MPLSLRDEARDTPLLVVSSALHVIMVTWDLVNVENLFAVLLVRTDLAALAPLAALAALAALAVVDVFVVAGVWQQEAQDV